MGHPQAMEGSIEFEMVAVQSRLKRDNIVQLNLDSAVSENVNQVAR